MGDVAIRLGQQQQQQLHPDFEHFFKSCQKWIIFFDFIVCLPLITFLGLLYHWDSLLSTPSWFKSIVKVFSAEVIQLFNFYNKKFSLIFIKKHVWWKEKTTYTQHISNKNSKNIFKLEKLIIASKISFNLMWDVTFYKISIYTYFDQFFLELKDTKNEINFTRSAFYN